jgi:arylsulfatase A-like enzyme
MPFSSDDRPNILWLVAEDMCPDLGCYGTDAIATPNSDRLAAEGLRYENAFCTSPTCSVSRSAMATGMYPTTIGAHHQRRTDDDPVAAPSLPDGVRVLPDWLRDAGYVTANLSTFPDGMACQDVYGKLDWNVTYDGEPFDTDAWAEMADSEPFFGQIAFHEAHRGEFWDTAHEDIPTPADPDAATIPPHYPDHPALRDDWAQYYNAIMALDRKVGSVVDRLAADGLLEDTVVVFTADHGRPFLRGKQTLFDGGLHVPLLVRWPERSAAPPQFERGAVRDELVSTIDLTATTLWLAGVAPPDTMQGRVFLGPDRDDPREYIYASVDRIAEVPGRARLVRSRRYSYIQTMTPHVPFVRPNRYALANRTLPWLLQSLAADGELPPDQERYLAGHTPEEQLYDLRADPFQRENIAPDEGNRERLRTFRRLLDDWIRRTDDRGRFPEGPRIREQRATRKAEQFDDGIADRMAEWGIEGPIPAWGIE